MSRVFLAEEVRLGRSVVVKVLPPEMAAGVSAERFEREIQLAAKLQHPHIVPLLTAGAKGDLLYYVMPHIAGESLRSRITHERALPVARQKIREDIFFDRGQRTERLQVADASTIALGLDSIRACDALVGNQHVT